MIYRNQFVGLFVPILLAVVIGGVMLSLLPQRAGAQTVSSVCLASVTTGHLNGKPALYVYTNTGDVKPKILSITFDGQYVPQPSDWGIRTDAPQPPHAYGVWKYYIASRWINLGGHWLTWDDNWRWSVVYEC